MWRTRGIAAAAAAFLAALALAGTAAGGVSVFATGLQNPRGLEFGPDGNLYVAEGGLGGTMSTVGQCQQVPAPIGPYSGGYTARISKITPAGARSTLVGGLPSSSTSPAVGSLTSGVADVAFIGDQLYALVAGAGCSHGLAGTSNDVIRVNADGTWSQVANLSAFIMANPVADPEEDDFEPDGTWYSMIAVRGDLYAVEPNHGELDRISTGGSISRVIDISASQGHIVPTSLAYHGNFFVGNLGTFPVVPGSENVFKITPSGNIKVRASGLTTVLGLAFDGLGRLYALESMTAPGFPGPEQIGSGKIVRVSETGAQETIASGLSFPTAMTFGPDGALYVSNLGFGGPPGQILRIDVTG